MKKVLPVIVISQFFCTSLWFAGNAVIGDIVMQFDVPAGWIAHLTSAVQLGFITGTLVFAVLSIADRFPPSKVFLWSAVIAALINFAICLKGISVLQLIAFRFLTGFFLAGVYPVGMKIASDYYEQGLGRSLGFLVGALVLGTAFPHLLKGMSATLPWQYVISFTSALSVLGGLAIWLMIPNGPYRKTGKTLSLTAFLTGFQDRGFRAVAFGYFGHMWELYAFWVFVPVMLAAYQAHNPQTHFSVPILSFLVIGSGSVSCVLGGLLSRRFGEKKTATAALFISCLCCLISPLVLLNSSPGAFIVFLFVWSMAVIADSPLFSTLVARNAPQESRGSSLTIVTCIGFSITILSIQLINALKNEGNATYVYALLAIGPVLGLMALVCSKKHLSSPGS